jgi:L-ascorbate metabolism protein UlaG (beta-lactamase superfamily)
MNITHIRNATQIIDYAGKKFLIDPMLADKGDEHRTEYQPGAIGAFGQGSMKSGQPAAIAIRLRLCCRQITP